MVSVGPMPCPVLMYHDPDGAMPACFQSLSSLALVPDSSAREAKGDFDRAMACSAGTIPAAWETFAGSAGGPTSTKSLCMTASRLAPWPCAMNVCSASGECTSRTSACPRAPRSMAWPDPTATVLTLHLLACSKAGTSVSSNPVSRVLVVVARIIWPLGVAVVEVALPEEPDPQAAVVSIAATSPAALQHRFVTSLSFV